MNEITSSQVILLLADMIGVVAVILALSILVHNPRQSANRITCLTISLLGVAILATTSLLRATYVTESNIAVAILIAVIPALGPGMLLTSLAIFKPTWITGKLRIVSVILLFLILAPILVTFIDVLFNTGLYYSPEVTEIVIGVLITFGENTASLAGQIVIILNLVLAHGLLIIFLAYWWLFDRRLEKRDRNLAGVLLGFQILALVIVLAAQTLSQGTTILITGFLYTVAFSFVAYQKLVSASQVQSGRLQTRLTLLMLVITVPAFLFLSSSLTRYAGGLIEQDANKILQENSNFLNTQIETWLTNNISMLQNLASLPDIVSMDPDEQKPVLELHAENYPFLYLLSTTDLEGVNIARSDVAPPIRYSDLTWFKNAARGEPVTLQTLIERTTGQPSLIASVPINQEDGKLTGVAMFASLLTDLNEQVLSVRLGETGYAYLIDSQNQLVAHRDLKPGAAKLFDYSEDPPVVALRSGIEPPFIYVDEEGVRWRAYYQRLENDWAIVVQQQENELFQPYQRLQLLSWLLIGGGMILVIVLVWISLQRAVQPINSLTQTVQAVTTGDLDQVAAVTSEDEVGTLAVAFNNMTSQVRNLVGDLEQRVAERTLALEYRSAQLQAAAEVGRAAASIRNLDELLPMVSRLISERFGFYHVGIFLLDEKREYALFRATNSPGGQRMLVRGHKLKVGQQGIVGYVTGKREPRVALNVGEDAVYFDNPDLPDTQSEMALPLMVGGELLGALDVQSIYPNAFTDQDIETLQVLADQVAIAINSAQLLQRTEALLEAERRSFAEVSRLSWSDQIHSMVNLGFVRERTGLRPYNSSLDPNIESDLRSAHIVVDPTDSAILYVPVIVRNQMIGVLQLVQAAGTGGWSEGEIDVMKSLSEQLGVALESARAYQQAQVSAQRDRALSEIGEKIRETLDIHAILRTASQEVRQAMDLPKVVIHLGKPQTSDGDGRFDFEGGSND
jgi:GAF domain-containing protein/HAMP domain-containing protein